MPAIPEGGCNTVTFNIVDSGIVSPNPTPDKWNIYDNADGTGTPIATGNFPGSTGSNPQGWSVTGDFNTATLCAPAGTGRTDAYKLRIPRTSANSLQNSLKYYDAVFTVTAAPCARPAPPEFKAANVGSTIKLTGTK